MRDEDVYEVRGAPLRSPQPAAGGNKRKSSKAEFSSLLVPQHDVGSKEPVLSPNTSPLLRHHMMVTSQPSDFRLNSATASPMVAQSARNLASFKSGMSNTVQNLHQAQNMMSGAKYIHNFDKGKD